MSFSEKEMDLIDGYINGQLNSTEKEMFSEKLRLDKEFAKAFQTTKLAKEAIRRKALKKEFQRLQSLEATLPKIDIKEEQPIRQETKKEIKQPKFKRLLVIAAGFLLLCFAGRILYNNGGSTPAEIFAQEFKAYPNLVNEITRNDSDSIAFDQKTLKEKAYILYGNQNYKEAIPFFETLVSEEQNPEDYFYLGVTYLTDEDPTQAIETLNLLKSKESTYTVRAYWYIALAHLKNNEVEKTKAILNEMQKIPNAGSYIEKAQRILDEL